MAAALVVTAAGLATLLVLRHRQKPRFTERDSVVLADFTNTTGDSIFDDALHEALAVKLEESPFLNIVSEARVREGLQFMGRSTGERLTSDLARELCQRVNGRAMVAGSIAPLGNNYVIALDVTDCPTGDSLARVQVQAANKEKVLDALGAAVSGVRARLGESLGSLQKFNTPLSQATTPSLAALKAYSLGVQAAEVKGRWRRFHS